MIATIPICSFWANPVAPNSLTRRVPGAISRISGFAGFARMETLVVSFLKTDKVVAARADLSPGDKLVYACLLDRVGQNAECWPGLRCVAKDCGMSVSGVGKCIDHLAELKLITVQRAGCNQHRRTNRYTVPQSGRPLSERPLSQARAPTQRARAPTQRTELDQENKTHRTRPIKARSARSDEWSSIVSLLPLILNTDRFRAAWEQWVSYRCEIRKRLTASMVKGQIAKLAKMGHDGAIASIEASITNGWTGLFEQKDKSDERGKTRSGAGSDRRLPGQVPDLKENIQPRVLGS